ncbi:hypothetical protein A0J48_001660 [Sphaerospermopsis aphanizomenoides BCCUSP55]|uniref:DUF6174 domain-containing protein n=1 Tax=Sphaerospermopsis aphanizomenoides TaxID=459663 RepID=UPI000A9C20EE|nr:DUF6174 domain-containing protein [Sphaerospermopsis aphanizomenoides]MBK1986269.1 hypothetical protein [Sphaerospermopsis aphanizomenoides BCCUSP55]
MRLPLTIAAGLVISLAFNVPVLSNSPLPTAQTRPNQAKMIQLQVNRRLWRKRNISNYRYTLTRSCFCTPEAREPVVIEVRKGVTTAVTSVKTNQPVDRELFKKYDNVPKLFNVIQDAINRKPSSLIVKYDPKFGYPTQINVDYNSQIADEELYLTVEKFQVIK